MREILFRGKRIDNDKWVYGLLCQYHEGVSAKIALNDFGAFDIGMAYCIDFSTVGQYTGLTDRNGTKIFDGDIIQRLDGKVPTGNFVIRWSEPCCGFTAGEGKRMWPNLNQATINAYGVIGNIHDNPDYFRMQEKRFEDHEAQCSLF